MTAQVNSLRVGGDKINDNFDELYTAIGTGTALNITTAGASSNQILQWSTTNNRFETNKLGSCWRHIS